MSQAKRTLFQLPQGTESFYLEEALKHKRYTAELENCFQLWGYLPVQTPVFDFFDAYAPLLRNSDLQKIYRLIDREGDLLMLRSDITLFLAKQMGTMLTEEDLPTRVYYADSILRHQEIEDISKNEFFQAGAELIGKDGIEADMEVLALLADVLSITELPEYRIHIGSKALFDAILTLNGKKEEADSAIKQDEAVERARKAVFMRQIPELETALSPFITEEKLRKQICEVLMFIGTSSDFKSYSQELLSDSAFPSRLKDEISYLESIVTELEESGVAKLISLDLSEIGSQPYYTGIVFRVYMQGAESDIASGGRYNNLLGSFGFKSPSVGFSLLVRKIEGHIKNTDRFNLAGSIEQVEGESFCSKLEKAGKLRGEGKRVVL